MCGVIGTSTAFGGAVGLPPTGKVYLGVGGNTTTTSYTSLTGRKHRIFGTFLSWGQSVDGKITDAANMDARLMIHLSTENSQHVEVLKPRGVARGMGDGYLIPLSRKINNSNKFVYVRPMAEMNGHWAPYSAYNKDGTFKGTSYSQAAYKNMFRRISLIMNGGDVGQINRLLAMYGMPRLVTQSLRLPRSEKVAIVWNPQGAGSPDKIGNRPQDFYPGDPYVDWIANDLYAQNGKAHWRGANALYSRYTNKPHMMAEWSVWGYDDPTFVKAMFNWVATHSRVRAIVWFHGSASTRFRLGNKPMSLSSYRNGVKATRYACPLCPP